MFDISLDLGNVPSVLAAMSNPHIAQHVANAAAQEYITDTHNWIADGHSFVSRGQLAQNINWRPLTNGEAEVYVNSGMHVTPGEDGAPDRLIEFRELAYYIEYGTGEFVGHRDWVIGPMPGRKGVKMKVTGGEGYIVRRQFKHHGSRPHPFFFADTQNRQTDMGNAARSVLASYMAGGAGG